MNNFKQLNEALNSRLEAGHFMDAFERFYAENVSMQENEEQPRLGKALNREQCGQFVHTFPDLRLTVQSVAYGPHHSVQEVLFNYTTANGKAVAYTEVAIRHWNEGLVQQERFYYAR